MSYKSYLTFYKLADNKQTREDWLFNEWQHGRVYQFNGEFYSTTTNEKIN